MKKTILCAIPILACSVLVGCSQSSSFEYTGAFGFDIGGVPEDGEDTTSTIPSDPLTPGETPDDTPVIPPICDPLNGDDDGADAENGLLATLTYLDPAQPGSYRMSDFVPGAPNVTRVLNDIFLSRVNKPTSPFDEGFIDANGNQLKKLNGDPLIEYFALFAASQITLGASDPEGEYQFALLADDGSKFYLDEGLGWVNWIDIDGTHSNKVGCSTETITLEQGDLVPMELGYFQAPMYHIAVMLFWRTGADLQTDEPFCDGSSRGNEFFFVDSDAGPVATSNFDAFLSRGWKLLTPENFVLPESVTTNPCL